MIDAYRFILILLTIMETSAYSMESPPNDDEDFIASINLSKENLNSFCDLMDSSIKDFSDRESQASAYLDTACIHLNRALQIKPDNFVALYNYGVSLMLQYQYFGKATLRKAREVFDHVHIEVVDDAGIRSKFYRDNGDLYYLEGRLEDAVECYRSAHQDMPEDDQLRQKLAELETELFHQRQRQQFAIVLVAPNIGREVVTNQIPSSNMSPNVRMLLGGGEPCDSSCQHMRPRERVSSHSDGNFPTFSTDDIPQEQSPIEPSECKSYWRRYPYIGIPLLVAGCLIYWYGPIMIPVAKKKASDLKEVVKKGYAGITKRLNRVQGSEPGGK